MHIHIMGTAAAEGWPGIWCRCDACRRARRAGGQNLRSRSGALIDGVIKIDLPPDAYMQAVRDGLDLSAVTDLLITHSHLDHLTTSDLTMLRPPFAHDNDRLRIWGSQPVFDAVMEQIRDPAKANCEVHVLEPGRAVELPGGESVMPLPAKHGAHTGPLNYIIQRGGRTLFYGLDSGWYPEESWQLQAEYVFDAVILDCTHGPVENQNGHGCVAMNIEIKKRMMTEGTAHEKTVFIATHFSHNGRLLHAELEEMLNPAGIVVAYDGFCLDI